MQRWDLLTGGEQTLHREGGALSAGSTKMGVIAPGSLGACSLSAQDEHEPRKWKCANMEGDGGKEEGAGR